MEFILRHHKSGELIVSLTSPGEVASFLRTIESQDPDYLEMIEIEVLGKGVQARTTGRVATESLLLYLASIEEGG